MLHCEVDSWNPLTDSIPIHSWVHPWLPLMKYRLEPLYQPIRTKLAHALQNWQPSDSSAEAVLLPWQKVFKQETWNAFMNKHIVPKLVSTMQQFIIDPRQQILDPWHWFIAWYDMVPLPSMIEILEKCFFPKWLQALNIWLSTNTNYQEIQRWYIGWRSLIPQAIINHTIIKKILTEGLMMIDRKISGTLNVQQTSPSQSSENVIYNTINNHSVTMSSSNFISSFKDLLEKRAMQYNVLFVPIRNRTFQEKQIYQLNVKKRIGAYSDNGGISFNKIHVLNTLVQPLTGCQGSTIYHNNTHQMFYTGLAETSFIRSHLSLYISNDNGEHWTFIKTIYQGSRARNEAKISRGEARQDF
ncbi:unnamed protein product [Rotaria magnacalcarata]|uniref:GCF C-terminal domain-containing protein n=3 Tax=Rotaria magnacalcarata TaxID=392030 RepID=A0A816HIW4_9BILA|nr:unnamed protein product [Rotaria magnacalcarata]CAF2070431.1 unnamed protein product [Rotaria magnacalcarata]CAF2142030.1 unnamed protein product [Rotaria magnacalcarata]CAF3862767.1 unnamed protein product [Rotaria magnacalcarata]CAF3888950.1 unnamed protein product [Rotaria magnacalcarata]